MPQAAPQQKTMDEALQESIAAHEAGQQEASAEVQQEAAPEEAEAQSAAEGEEGQQEAPAEATPEEPEQEAPSKQAKAKAPSPAPSKGAKDGKQPPAKGPIAPSSWPAHMREEFHKLPRPVKDLILKQQGDYVRREAAFSRDMHAAKQQIEAVKPLSDALAPFMSHLEAVGVAPAAAVRNLFQTEYALRTGPETQKAAIIAGLMGSYNVSPAALVAAMEGKVQPETQAQPQQRRAPEVPKDPRVDVLLTNLQRQAKSRQETQEQQDEIALREFVDSGKAEFFEDVHKDMIALDIAAKAQGQRLSWDELYERACYVNPSVRSVLKKREADEAAALRSQKAQQARRAASSVRTEPGAPQGARKASLDEALKRDIEAHYGPQAV